MFSLTRARTLLPSSKLQLFKLQAVSLSGSSIKSLQDAFRDPSSPFHIAPGQAGPESPDAPLSLSQVNSAPTTPQLSHPGESNRTTSSSPAENARAKLISMGYDAESLWEQSTTWGHHDAFRHVNNAHCREGSKLSANKSNEVAHEYATGRIMWLIALGKALGGEERVKAMLAGQGISLILKSINVNFRRPVTFPDTVLVGHKSITSSSRTQFTLNAALYSYSQQAIVADSDSAIVWYDYDSLKKCDPVDRAWDILKAATKDGQVEG